MLPDDHGLLDKAYATASHLFFDEASGTLAVAGTDMVHSPVTDIVTDLWNVPTNSLDKTTRYAQLTEAVRAYAPKTLIGHSLGAAVVGTFMANNPHAELQARLYAWPTWHRNRDTRIRSYRGRLDLIAVGDSAAETRGWGHGY